MGRPWNERGRGYNWNLCAYMQGDRVELSAPCQREIAFQSTGYLFSFTSPFFLRPRPVGGLILRLFDGGAEGSWSTACLDARA